jgi:hypothetical protein
MLCCQIREVLHAAMPGYALAGAARRAGPAPPRAATAGRPHPLGPGTVGADGGTIGGQ